MRQNLAEATLREGEGVEKISSSKLQAPGKHQTPNFKANAYTWRGMIWDLKCGASLELGAWSLVLSRQSLISP